jgi:CBS domain-containing protein
MHPDDAPRSAMYGFLACTARQFMRLDVKTVSRRTTMRELSELFERHDFNAFPVLEEGKMLGIVSKFDFLRAFAFTSSQIVPHYDELMKRTVAGGNDRGRRACRSDVTANARPRADGAPRLGGSPANPLRTVDRRHHGNALLEQRISLSEQRCCTST